MRISSYLLQNKTNLGSLLSWSWGFYVSPHRSLHNRHRVLLYQAYKSPFAGLSGGESGSDKGVKGLYLSVFSLGDRL